MRTWVNGALLTDPDAPAVAARDHGMTVGDGVFEVFKVVDGCVFATDRRRWIRGRTPRRAAPCHGRATSTAHSPA
jgi:branched-subunit amino acid aminotransferase/4-amino-4-deoxychorismate lyase